MKRTRNGKAKQFLHEVVLSYEGDDCLIWPFAKMKKGYGHINIEGKMKAVHRLACAYKHGDPPSVLHQAAHSCGNGRGGCVNPNHVRWATVQENEDDKKIHGTVLVGEKNGRSKLNESKVREIFYADGSQRNIAKSYGVSMFIVNRIKRGLRWKHLKLPESFSPLEPQKACILGDRQGVSG